MLIKFLFLLASLSLILHLAQSVSPASTCLGNCIACDNNNPLLCRNLLNHTSGKEYSCLPYYSGSNCQQSVNSYYNLYNETGPYLNWSLPSSPPALLCKLIPPQNSNNSNFNNMSFSSIGPFSSSLNATKSLSFSAAQNIQRLVLKVSVAIADAALYNGSLYSNETTVETTDSQGNIIIETVSTPNKSGILPNPISFFNLAVTDQQSSNSLIASFSTSYSTVSNTNTSCGFVYQYQFVVSPNSTSSSLRQILLNFYLSAQNSQTTWYLLGFSVQGGCSGFTVSTNSAACSTCLSGFYPTSDPDGILQSCSVCDYHCSTCSAASTCLLCESYTTNPTAGVCEFPSSYGIYQVFTTTTGRLLNLSSKSSSQFFSVASSQSQLLNLGINLSSNQSYLIKFYLLYSQSFAQTLSLFNIAVNGQPYTSYSSLDTFASTLLQQANNGVAQLFSTAVKIDLMGKPCISNFTLSLKGTSQSTEQFYVANLVLIQYSCVENCLTCTLTATTQSSTCTQCMPFFSLAQNCKTCSNGFYLRDSSVCVKCYSNCKQCKGSALNQCTDCLSQFTLGEYVYSKECIQCIYGYYNGKNKNCNFACPQKIYQSLSVAQVDYNPNCTLCMKSDINQIYLSQACKKCWVDLGLASGKCIPLTSSGYVYYANDLANGQANSSLWKGNQALSSFTCTSDYVNLYGISQSANHTSKVASTLTYTLSNLPVHRGIIIVFNIFKIDDWLTSNLSANSNTTLVINTVVNSPGYQGTSFNISLNNNYGSNICGSSGREMIWGVQTDLNDHSGSQVTMTINSPDQGIFVRQLQVYLGNCPDCNQQGLSFNIFAIPMYSDNDTQTGLDVWITFNHPVYYNTKGNQSQANISDSFAKSFQFSINGTAVPNSYLTENEISNFNYIKYFVPLTQSYKNTSLVVSTSNGDAVYTTDGGITRMLISSSNSYQVDRYDNTSPDIRRNMSQLSTFFNFFTWFTLIFMIVCVMLGVGVVFEEFSIMMQIIYYHIYITSALLPPTIKVPLASAVRMEHLNYFSDIPGIENSLFGDLVYPADYIFQQFNVDVYFLRLFYPIMIINAIYLGWFLINFALYKFLPACTTSQHKLLRFFRSIPQRPLAYFDQIWRYQFLATMWACMLQFTNFTATGGQVVSLIICVLAFSISVVWPFAVTIFTYRRHYVMNVNHFRYCYHDIYYLKISSVADEPKYYLYVAVRFGKLLAYAIFIALFINQFIIGPVLLIFANIIESAIAYFLKIYRSGYYLFTRIIQNLLLCVSAILCLIMYGSADSMSQDSFENLGYGLSTVFVLLIVNGICRFIYLIYKKAYQWKIGTYDIGQYGEKENYDDKGPIRLAESERV